MLSGIPHPEGDVASERPKQQQWPPQRNVIYDWASCPQAVTNSMLKRAKVGILYIVLMSLSGFDEFLGFLCF